MFAICDCTFVPVKRGGVSQPPPDLFNMTDEQLAKEIQLSARRLAEVLDRGPIYRRMTGFVNPLLENRPTLLVYCASLENIENYMCLSLLLELTHSPPKTNKEPHEPLLDINAVDGQFGATALHWACINGNVILMVLLLKYGAGASNCSWEVSSKLILDTIKK